MAIKSAIIFPIKFNTLIKNNFDKKQLIAQCTIPVSLFFFWEGGNIGLFITLVPKVFIVTFSYLLAQQLWGYV